MENSTKLRLTLQQVKEDNYQVPADYKITDLVSEMLNHIGDPEPELRDELIYSILAHWIINGYLTDDKLKEILYFVMNEDHLFYKIGDANTDSVFTRSFSILHVALILYKHRKKKLFNEEEFMGIFKNVTRYFLEERDLRGYVEDNGWAHSVAHTADVLDELALCNEIGYRELHYLLEIIQEKVCVGSYVYINEEDERLVTAVISILDRKLLSIDEVCQWIKSYGQIQKTGIYIDDYYTRINIKNFLRSLYFRILSNEELKAVVKALNETMNDISNNK